MLKTLNYKTVIKYTHRWMPPIREDYVMDRISAEKYGFHANSDLEKYDIFVLVKYAEKRNNDLYQVMYTAYSR